MSKYTEEKCAEYLRKHGVKLPSDGRTIIVKSGQVGLKGLAMLDYLQNELNYIVRFQGVSE